MVQELEKLGLRVAELRNKRNLTQEKLAELVNYSTNHIAKLESARTALYDSLSQFYLLTQYNNY